MLKGKSVQIRLTILILLTTTLIIAAYSTYDYLMRRNKLTSSMDQLAQNTSIRLGKGLVDPLWNINKNLIDEVLKSEMTEKNLFALVIHEGDSKRCFPRCKERQRLERRYFQRKCLGRLHPNSGGDCQSRRKTGFC